MMVSILMITYNHEKYIAQAIDSVLMQKTNFDFEIVIGEDCSIDRTREILIEYKTKYPNKINLILQDKNVGISQNFINTSKKCKGKYIAFCEGDDYWTDPYKLQKQVDFLEANPDYGLVHTNVNVVDEDNKVIYFSNEAKPQGDVFFYLLTKSAFIVTCSVCARGDFIRELANRSLSENLTFVFDYWLWLHIAMRSKVHYMDEVTSAYRSHSGGITKSGNAFFKSVSPIAVLDVINTKLKIDDNLRFNEKWKLLEKFYRSLMNKGLDNKTRIKYYSIIISYPFFLLTIFPVIFKKILSKFFRRYIG